MKNIPKSLLIPGWFFIVTSVIAAYFVMIVSQLAILPTYSILISFLLCVLQFVAGILLIQGKNAGKILTYVIGALSIFDLIASIASSSFPLALLIRIAIICTVLFAPTAKEYFSNLKEKEARY